MRAIKTLLVASQPVAQATSTRSRSPRLGPCLEHRRVERTNGVSALRGTCRGRWPAMADRVWVAAGLSWTKPDGRCRSHSWRPRRPTLGSVPRCDGREFVPVLASRGPRAHRPEAGRPHRPPLVESNLVPETAVRQRKPVIDRSLRGLNTIRTHPVRGRGKIPPREKAEKHGRETNSEGARPCTPDAVQEARVQRA
jgi:hypothetical protein